MQNKKILWKCQLLTLCLIRLFCHVNDMCGILINELFFLQLFDERWHKIMLGVTDTRAKLWVDCKPVKSVDGYIESPLRERGAYDIDNGYLSIAQTVDNHGMYQVRNEFGCWVTFFCDWFEIFLFFLLPLGSSARKMDMKYDLCANKETFPFVRLTSNGLPWHVIHLDRCVKAVMRFRWVCRGFLESKLGTDIFWLWI